MNEKKKSPRVGFELTTPGSEAQRATHYTTGSLGKHSDN